MNDTYLGKIAYDAYCANTGGVSLISGARLPPFNDLKEEIKLAWEAAGRAVLAYNEEMMEGGVDL